MTCSHGASLIRARYNKQHLTLIPGLQNTRLCPTRNWAEQPAWPEGRTGELPVQHDGVGSLTIPHSLMLDLPGGDTFSLR